MSLREERITVEGNIITYDKVAIAIENLRTYEQIALQKTGDDGNNGFYVCVSGGKDSSVIQELCLMAGVKCQFYHNHTGLDHPKTVYFVRSEKKRIEALGYNFYIIPPRKNIFKLSQEKGMLPTRLVRYCCAELKERGGENRFIVTGVRRAESVGRSDEALAVSRGAKKKDRVILQNDNTEERRTVDHCVMKGTLALNVIVDWTDVEVWEFIHKYNVPVNPLYAEGYKRVGCVGCPMSTHKAEELEANPKYKQMWLRICAKLIATGKSCYDDPQDLYDWWVEKDKRAKSKIHDEQIGFELED